jgi:hypothetical protein
MTATPTLRKAAISEHYLKTESWDRSRTGIAISINYDVIRMDFAEIQAQKRSGAEILDDVENCLNKELRKTYFQVQYDSELDKDLVDQPAKGDF